MRRQDLILTLLLILSLCGLGFKLYRGWHNYAAQNGPQALEVRALTGVSVPPPAPARDYSLIARQNPFHPDRNDTIALPADRAQPIGPPPLIYGSVILGNTRFALMATEQSPKAEQVSEGSMFNGYRLVKVSPESVVLDSGAGSQEIMLYNALEKLHRQSAKTVAASSGPRPSAPAPVISSTSNPQPMQTDVANAGPVNLPPTPPSPATPAIAAPPGKVVMDTPFGPILVDKKP